MSRSSHWFGGVVGIFAAAIVIFLFIYFFVPEVSSKFFGVAFGEAQDVTEAILSYIGTDIKADDEIKEFLSSKDGKKIVKEIISLSKKGGSALKDAFDNPRVKEIFKEASEYAEKGLGSVGDYLSSHMKELEDLL